MSDELRVQQVPAVPLTKRHRYIVQMLDGRELWLDHDFSLAAAMSEADERLENMRSWHVIGFAVSEEVAPQQTDQSGARSGADQNPSAPAEAES